ncbi:uncharacterized protein LOC124162602 [Ischnura elegans]|uniref:uncharacterized protein LOC124162602 n=1 Tax=Ischnura elegans TaxID=197161 RepID=UPI001ED86B04|nr:uncharacterized protein LOC124162602 [Ischnura elegans]
MDNASYHSVVVDKVPTTSSKKIDILGWLEARGIPHNPRQTRAELLCLVNAIKPRTKTFELDSIAQGRGHAVVRLPPYHCHYNPKLIWSQVKGAVAKRNTTFKMADIEVLMNEELDRVTAMEWEKCVQHAEKIQEDDYRRDTAIDSVMESIVINLQDDSSDSLSDESDEDDIL